MNVLSRFKRGFKNRLHALQAIKANYQQEFPFRKLKLIGVTGTNGKTTTTQMIYHILKKNGLKAGYLSTISAMVGDKSLDTGFHVTTPDPWIVPTYLRKMVDAGIEYVVVESTSQGLEQNRLWGIEFEAVTITNIQSDHLDYHGTWENYARAKFRIIEKLQKNGLAVLNRDDTRSAEWIKPRLAKLKKPVQIIWSSKKELEKVTKDFDGFHFTLNKVDFELPLLGEYNLENALEAIRVCAKYLPLEKIANALKSFPVPVGRMELMQKEPFVVIIDFAHTPEALEASLNTLQELKQQDGRIISVFGCAGKRDVERRKMGAVAARLSEVTILTAEDPRDEKLAEVNNEILGHGVLHGAEEIMRYPDHNYWVRSNIPALDFEITKTLKTGKKPFILFNEDTTQSRSDAIECALNLARPGDIVFLTGKAHEPTLCFGETEYPWSEHETVKGILPLLDKKKAESSQSSQYEHSGQPDKMSQKDA